MTREGAVIIIGLLAVACTAYTRTRVPLAVSASTMSDMRDTTSLVQKRRLTSLNCRKAGYRKRTAPYYQCMRALIARDLQRTRDLAETYVREAARRGTCMNRTTFRIARCLEI